jgi:hypothetical protein
MLRPSNDSAKERRDECDERPSSRQCEVFCQCLQRVVGSRTDRYSQPRTDRCDDVCLNEGAEVAVVDRVLKELNRLMRVNSTVVTVGTGYEY